MNKISAIYVSILALVVAVAALVLCLVCCQKNKPVSVEETLMNNPEIIVKALQAQEQKMRDEAMKQAQALIQDNMDEIVNAEGVGVIGNPEGTVTVVEFFDFSCHFCHRLYPALMSVVANNPDVKVVFREMTFLAPVSEYAARASLAAGEQGKYAEVYSALMESEGSLTEAKVDELAVKAGVDLEKMKADMNSEKISNLLKSTSELAQKLQINGVPTLIINGQIVQTLDEKVIQDQINQAKAAK